MSIEPPQTAPVLNLEPDYAKILLKTKKYVENITPFYQFTRWSGKFHKLYTVYRAKPAIGNPDIYIFTRQKEPLETGNQFLRIIPMQENDLFDNDSDKKFLYPVPKFKIVAEIAKEHGISLEDKETKEPKTIDEVWLEILQLHLDQLKTDPFLFKIQQPLSKEEIEEIKKWDFEKVKETYFYEGLDKDPHIVYAFESKVISFTTNPMETEDTTKKIQPFNDNELLLAMTKTGKSTVSDKIGLLYTSATAARLIGFSTADSTEPGDCNGINRPIICDNVHNYKSEYLRQILELLESGRTFVGKGKQKVPCRNASPFVFIANPPGVEDNQILAECFLNCIELLNETGGAVGSRFSEILLGLTLKPVTGKPLHDDIIQKNRLVFEHIIPRVNRTVESKIFPNPQVQKWLNESMPDYRESIEKFLEKEIMLPQAVKEFWLDHATTANRHIRGKALKHSVLDNLKALYLGSFDIQEILDDAEDHLEKIKTTNIESLHNMLKFKEGIPFALWVRKRYESISKEFVQALILGVAVYVKENEKTIKKGFTVPLEYVDKSYNSVLEPVKPKPYSYFSHVRQKIKDLNKTNRVTSDFGFSIVHSGALSVLTVEFTGDSKQLITLATELVK